MTIDAFDPRGAIRNPDSPAIRLQARAAVVHESAIKLYFLEIFLGCVLVAVASVLPLVMFLHG